VCAHKHTALAVEDGIVGIVEHNTTEFINILRKSLVLSPIVFDEIQFELQALLLSTHPLSSHSELEFL
jgi:hypothetical protein